MNNQVPSKTAAHDLVNNRFFSNINFQNNFVIPNKPFTSFPNQYNLYSNLINTRQKADPITAEIQFWKKAAPIIETLPPEFVLYWKDKFESTHPEVKAGVTTDKTILQPISDSINHINRQNENISSRYTVAYDIDFDSVIPSALVPNLEDKVSYNAQTNYLQSSTHVNSLFNLNINKIYDGSLQTSSHGTNLATDIHHIERLSQNKDELMELTADYVGSVFETIIYLTSYKLNNIQKIEKLTFVIDVEGIKTNVDILGNQVEVPSNKTTKDLLA